MQTLSKPTALAIANDYIYEVFGGNTEISVPEIISEGSADLRHAVQEIIAFLRPEMPSLCTAQEMAARPGKFIPILRVILAEYTLEHQRATEEKTQTLPRLFSLSPKPSLRWRFIILQADALGPMLGKNYSRSQEERTQLFNEVFNKDFPFFNKYYLFLLRNFRYYNFTNVVPDTKACSSIV